MKKILILMSDTGGGHRASAEALRDAFLERYGDRLQIDMVDLWLKHMPPPLRQVPQTYRFIINDLPWLYRLLYEAWEKPQVTAPVLRAVARLLQGQLSRVIRQYDPHVIVSVHPLMQEVPLRVLARMKRDTPFATVVTDLVTIAPAWFVARATLCFVPSDEGYRLALRAGLRPEQLREFGLPIRPAFARPPRPKAVLRQELGMNADLPAALIVGGGEGMGPVGEIAQAVASRLSGQVQPQEPAGQLVVICGRHQRLQEELSAYPWPVPTVVRGFVENIWDWMAASDCVITKAGPGTIAEALALGLPLVLSGYIPGQESGNVPYVLKHGVGVYVQDPWQIAEVIGGWFGPQRDKLEQIATNARRLGRPGATFQIIEEIAGLLPSA